jgi:vesicle coat complex subunit
MSSNSKFHFILTIKILKRLLRSIYIDKDPLKKKDVIKKVIAYMTLGIDVSKLYPEMVKASRTEDVVTKKMVYLYLINYAQ